MSTHVELPSNTKVKVTLSGPPPDDVKCVKDVSVNPRTRRQLIEGFWKGHKTVRGHVAFVANESHRDRLRREGKIMVRISDLSAQHIMVVVPSDCIQPA